MNNNVEIPIGDQLAFPLPATSENHCQGGMTCRQWLVGQIAGGLAARVGSITSITAIGSVEEHARWAIDRADAIIKRLEANE